MIVESDAAASDFSTAVRRILGSALAGLLLLVAGCATQPAVSEDAETFSVSYRHAGLGVGPGAVQGVLILPEGLEASVASRSIVLALQELEASIVAPEVPLGEWLPEKEQWRSDRVPVTEALVADHNQAHPDLTLPPRQYKIQYSGQYMVDRRELVFKISARLYEKALATDWREFNKEGYSGTFFVGLLRQLINDNLRTAAEEAEP
jgi:hypothetical protein